MKKKICSLLTLSLALGFLTASYAQDAELDPVKASDVNADGKINILDLTLIAAHFGETSTADQTPNPDVNGDGTVNILDLTIVARYLGETVYAPVAFVGANPAIGAQIAANAFITVVFDSQPDDVTVSAGVATVAGKIVTITGPFPPGFLDLTITWTGGSQTLTYTVTVDEEEAPAAAFASSTPLDGGELAPNGTISITFDNAPGDVTVSVGQATVAGKTATVTGPFTAGPLALIVNWTNGGGVQALIFTVTAPDTKPPKVTGGTVEDGEQDVDPEVINTDRKIEIEFSEDVFGNLALQTEGGDDVGWLGKVEGNKGILELVKGKEIDTEATYVIAGIVSDTAGNEIDIRITFITASETAGIPIEVTDATFDSVVLGSELPIVVKFKADWCPFCRRMAPIVAEVASEHRETFAVAILDIDESRQTTTKYQIRGIPTYIVFQDREVVGRFGGAMPKANLVQNILNLIKSED